MDKYIKDLSVLYYNDNIYKSLSIMEHSKQALEYENISEINKEAIIIASLFINIDDTKIKSILNDREESFIKLVIEIIKLANCLDKDDNLIKKYKFIPWILIPRYSKKIEKFGLMSIKRCYEFNIKYNRPLYLKTTPRLTDENEIIKLSIERYSKFDGNSKSMIDHFYDKLIGMTFIPTNNKYIYDQCIKQRKILINFIKYFSMNNKIDMKMV